jgi:hypothetical protein
MPLSAKHVWYSVLFGPVVIRPFPEKISEWDAPIGARPTRVIQEATHLPPDDFRLTRTPRRAH